MPPKRKIQAVNKDSSFSGDSPYSKRPRRSAVNQSELAQSVFDVLKDFEDENGHLIADSFMKLPSKRQNPDYYEKIIDPVDLTKIGQRIRMDEYRDIEILTTDMQLMVSNAKKYYPEDSQEYTDACNLWEIYLNTKARILEEAKNAEPPKLRAGRRPRPRQQFSEEAASDYEPESEVSADDLKEIFESLTTEADENGRVIAQLFMHLPDKSNAQYYETIRDPIDFFMISDRIDEGAYNSMGDFEKDVKMLVKNAKVFNEPGSQIYEDAVTISHILKDKVAEFERGKKQEVPGVKTSARLKQRRSWGKLLDKVDKQSKDDTKAKHDVCIPDPGEEDYQALFYNAVVNFRNVNGHTIADPFVRLPNKRFYPMYYEEIENPISLKIIRKKIVSRKYDTCSELQEDFDLLFQNAMLFNIASSQIHKDAATLQKFMRSKAPDYAAKEEECMEDESETDAEGDEDEEHAVCVKTENVTSSTSDSNDGKVKKRRRRKRTQTARDLLQERLRMLYDAVLEAENPEGREMITLFLEKPSRKDYPDYYKLVLEPIDMKTIDKKIRQEKYTGVEDMLEDFSLMFNNARHYNEPGSEVYNDANDLEKLLLEKHKEAGSLPEIEDDGSLTFGSSKSTKKSTESKLDQLFSAVRDHTDATKRMICDIFMQLPTKQELPDYYKVIKKPMEMDRIQQKMQAGHYLKIEEMLLDMLLMFENACTYNEPGSVIYKDALILQKLAVETFYNLEKPESPTPPDQLVHEILTNLYVSVLGHQDESGRCYSESLCGHQSEGDIKQSSEQGTETEQQATTQESPPNTGVDSSKLTLEVIRKNLCNRRYRRLDVFQEHMFEVFEEVRNNNRTDSETYEDVVELQKFFIRIRDELCKNGETLMSTALAFTSKMLDVELDQEKKEKQPQEAKEDEEIKEEGKELREKMQMSSQSEEMDIQGTRYNVGDFVYVENPDPLKPHHIVCIEKLYTDETGERRLYGVWFLRPEATYHFPSKKFMLKEVFKSDYYNTVPVSLIRGRCFVMLAKDYFKMKPTGFPDEDVYVCESRYSSRAKSFKRIKFLQLPPNSTELVQRETALPVIRMPSCYSDTKPPENVTPQGKGQTLSTQGIDPLWPVDEIPKERENIKTDTQNPHSEATYYSQYFVKNMWIKLGDCVYVKQPNSSELKISRIERLWTDSHANVWLHGPWFVRPTDVEHEPTRMFYKNELFLSAIEDTYPMSEVVGKCLVMAHKDFCACRPTELPEKDIYLYESRYADRVIKKIKVKRYAPSFKMDGSKSGTRYYYWEMIYKLPDIRVVDDEYYYYKKPNVAEYVLSPLLTRLVQDELISRENEARMEAAQASAAITEGGNAAIPGYPNQAAVYQQHQPYMQQPNMMTQYPYQGYQSSPAPGQPPHAQGALHHPHYMGQQYGVNQGYPSPHGGVVQHPHMQGYHNSPQYPTSPHPNMIASSPGLFQSPDSSRPSSGHPDAAATPPPKKKGRVGHSTGYILFASHCHPRVRAENPDMAFGEISKIVGEEWRSLEEDKKREYEEKAREQSAKLEAEGKIIAKKKKKKKDGDEVLSQSSTPQPTMVPGQHYATPYQHTPGQYPNVQQQAPVQHHPQQQQPRMPMPGSAGPHQMQPPAGYPSSASPMTPYTQTPGQYPQPQQPTPVQAPSLAEKHRMRRGALFVKPPPKAQRVMHSEAYLRYIEGLEKGSKTVSNWSRSMKVKERDVVLSREEMERLPVHWLGNGKGQHESAKSALWALRDYMLKDALTIKQSLSY